MDQYDEAKQICKEMVSDRGYTMIIAENPESFTAQNHNNTSDMIHIQIIRNSKVNIRHATDLISILAKSKIKNAIIIYGDSVTPSTVKLIDDTRNVKIQLFNVDELQFNITKHVLQPVFRKITGGEYLEMKRFSINKFPKMSKHDAICKYYNFNIGDLIEISDQNEITRYRLVI